MVDSDKYKHIKVSSTRKDEVVIKAGKREAHDEKPASVLEKDSQPSTVAAPKSEDSANIDTPKKSPNDAKANSEYHPTTLDDIEGSKMSSMQLIVIGLALIALAAFIIWYVVIA